MACSNAHAAPRAHSRSPQRRSARKASRGPGSSRCQAATRSSAGSAAPEAADVDARRRDVRRRRAGCRGSGRRGSSRRRPRGAARATRAHRRRSGGTSSSPSLLREARLHPGVVVRQVAAAVVAGERPAAGVDRAHARDELGEVVGERLGLPVGRRHGRRAARSAPTTASGSRARAPRSRPAPGWRSGSGRGARRPPRPPPPAARASPRRAAAARRARRRDGRGR